jgi:uncharacterized membrane protein
VNSGIVVNAEPEAQLDHVSGIPGPSVTSGDGIVERWLSARLNLVVLGVIADGFLIRVYAAGRSFLNPDEALHYLILNQRSAFWAYKISLTNAHPPLIYILLYYWKFLGRSELMLRFPSVLAGTAVCWFAYKWIETIFGKAAGVIGLILVAFSPSLVALSAEVRSYALLLFCETADLYLIEIALREKSARRMWRFSMFLYLAILSHYSAIFFVLAVGIYALARIGQARLPQKVVAAWAAGQAGALAVYVFLYVTHVSKLKPNIAMWEVSFDKGYSHSGHEHLFTFARERTMDIFIFLFENHRIAQALFLTWIAAVAILVVREWVYRRKGLGAPFASILLVIPIIAVFGAGVAGYYPYVGSRHTVILAPFVIATLSFLLAMISRQKVWAAIVIAALLVGASNTSGQKFDPYIAKENQSRALMESAMNHIQQTIPSGDLIMTDYQSALLLVYYLCGPELILPIGTFNLPTSRAKCNGHTIVSFQAWGMQTPFFLSQFGTIAHAQRLTPGERVWIFQSGWGPTLARELPLASPQFRCLNPKTFGGNISVIPLAVGPDFAPVATVPTCPASAVNLQIM